MNATEPKFKASMAGKHRVVLEIYGEIGPAWAGMIDETVVAAALKEAGDVQEIECRIHSIGGDAFAGLAIFTILKNHPAKKYMRVEGIAASAATLFLMAGDEIVVPKNAMLMIHDPVTVAWGFEADLLKAVEMLATIKAAGIETYASKTKKSKEEIAKLMSDETWFTGEEAVAAGFADKTDSEVKLLPVEQKATARNLFRRAPSQLASLLLAVPQQKGFIMPDVTQESSTLNATQQAKPASQESPEQGKATEQQLAAIQAVAAPLQVLTQADVDKAAKDAAQMALQQERERTNDITALCCQAGRPSLANEFIANGKSVAEVQQSLFKALCEDRKPADDGGTPQQSGGDPDNQKYKSEYAKQRAAFQKVGVSEEDYIASRRVDDGLDVLQTASAK